MADQESSTASGASPGPPLPPAGEPEPELTAEIGVLGRALLDGTSDVLQRTLARVSAWEEEVDPVVQERFQRINISSTCAIGRWLAGEGAEVAREVGKETWLLYGELAARRQASLAQLVRRCLAWRDSVVEVLHELAHEHGSSSAALTQTLHIVQLSLEFSLVRMSKCFDRERARSDEELARREEELAFMATHDDLTGLPNRTLILDRTEQMLARVVRSRTPVVALFIDLDNFKTVNDTFGHPAGDVLLRSVAARLDGLVRGSDAVGRLGGDEFVMICEGPTLQDGPELIAERVLEALAPPFELDGQELAPIHVAASIGIAVGEQGTAEELLRAADIAMYRAKLDGKNRFAMFEATMVDAVRDRRELEEDLREAVEREELFLVYQPTLALSDMSLTGFEALVRWLHPHRGVVPPDEFIPVAEELGVIGEVGRWVLRHACAQAAEWRALGHSIGIAVNVSAIQLDDDVLIEDIKEALHDSGLDARALTIEITESTLMQNAEQTAARLEQIKQLGVRIAIDDFGTGYSSLAHLQRFPVDALKIDRSFVAGLSANRESETLIQTLVHLGKALSIETLAEGIEQEQQLTKLRDERCDSGQGFLLARPLDRAAAESFLFRSARPAT